MPTPQVTQRLSGWGRYPVATGVAVRPEKVAGARGAVASAEWPSVLGRGLGRSYGDAAFDPQGCAILTERLDRMLAFDPATGLLRAEAGVTFAEILQVFVPRGWFLPVTPGTRHVCLGGAVACDVHGKNHHHDGTLKRHLGRLRLLLASGEDVECSADERPDLFHATVGGMGLTGLILEAELRLVPLETAWIRQTVVPAGDLDEMLARMEEHDQRHRYAVAWLDSLAGGRRLGRGALMVGDHLPLAELPPGRAPLPVPGGALAAVPLDAPGALLNPLSLRAFNTAWYEMQRRKAGSAVVGFGAFFYPLDALDGWNRLYGRRGFVQYQFVTPLATSRATVAQVLERCASAGRGSFLTVLKRFGPGAGWLSFPFEGYTLALDFPNTPGLLDFLAGLDRLVLEAGGRVYLAKDVRLDGPTFRAMYPEYPRWLQVKSEIDPGNRFQSALSRRLGIEVAR